MVWVWVKAWRVDVWWESAAVSPTREIHEVRYPTTVAELRAIRESLVHNPWVASYNWRPARSWDTVDDPATCPAGHEIVPAGVRDVACRGCGGHRRFRCHLDGWSVLVPTPGVDCGSV